jgi:hypothetical protein
VVTVLSIWHRIRIKKTGIITASYTLILKEIGQLTWEGTGAAAMGP